MSKIRMAYRQVQLKQTFTYSLPQLTILIYNILGVSAEGLCASLGTLKEAIGNL